MKIGITGAGKVGSTLGKKWAKAGHDIVFGSRQPQGEKAQALVKSIGPKVSADTIAGTAQWAEVVVLALPWSATEETLKAAGNLAGKVLIDCTNPIGPGRTLAVGLTTSAGEQVAGWAAGARVVKAFNTTGFDNMENPDFGGQKASMFFCGDDPGAKAVVARLIEEVGFEPVDSGGLVIARYLEPLCLLWLNLVTTQGLGRNIAFKLLRK
jgi:predicted dinucleotide-binding enzyme